MNSHHLSTYARVALITAVAGLMSACASSPYYYDPDPYYSPRMMYYDYWYYPAIGAYYDPGTQIYIYYEHNHWIRTRTLPTHIRPYLGHHVTVRSPRDRPYEEHHRHRQQYQPERYRERNPDHRHEDVWIGSPHQPSPQQDHDDRRRDSRDRNGKELRHEPERGAIPVPQKYREPDVNYPRQPPDTRPGNTSRHRDSASTAPLKREEKWRQPEIRREKSRDQYRNGDVQRNNERRIDHDRSGSSTRQPRQYRTPDTRRQYPKTPPQAAPGHREPVTRTVPAKPDDKGLQRENRKEESQHQYRDGTDRNGKVYDDATIQRR